MPEARKVDPTPVDDAPPDQPTSSVDRFCAEIIAGRHTGHLVQILDAVHHQLLEGPSSRRWKIDLGFLGAAYTDRIITEDGFSFDEACEAERISDRSWAGLDPMMRANDCRAVILAHLCWVDKMPQKAARELVGQFGFNEVAQAISIYEVADDPKEVSASSAATTTS